MQPNLKHFEKISYKTNEFITKTYSTSFSHAVGMLPGEKRKAIYSIYGFVRFADEIVDTFHTHDKATLLENFEKDLKNALETGMSMNPVLHSFALTLKKYNIEYELVNAFLASMKSDIDKKDYFTQEELKTYIYGSAEVVGLMCLKVFLNGDNARFENLKNQAISLGSAFQKVNFLRDLKADTLELSRSYFPQLTKNNFDEITKNEIVADIETDFEQAYKGIGQLPGRSKLAVLIAYNYYSALLGKIKKTDVATISNSRLRIPGTRKFFIMLKSVLEYTIGT